MKEFLNDLLGIVAPLILVFIGTVGPVYVTILAQKAVSFMNIKNDGERLEVEAKFRDALHQSAWNAVNFALGKLGIDAERLTLGGGETQVKLVREALEYVKDKNPDAIKALGVDDGKLAEILIGKLQSALTLNREKVVVSR